MAIYTFTLCGTYHDTTQYDITNGASVLEALSNNSPQYSPYFTLHHNVCSLHVYLTIDLCSTTYSTRVPDIMIMLHNVCTYAQLICMCRCLNPYRNTIRYIHDAVIITGEHKVVLVYFTAVNVHPYIFHSMRKIAKKVKKGSQIHRCCCLQSYGPFLWESRTKCNTVYNRCLFT